jgi:hypothetical protein
MSLQVSLSSYSTVPGEILDPRKESGAGRRWPEMMRIGMVEARMEVLVATAAASKSKYLAP